MHSIKIASLEDDPHQINLFRDILTQAGYAFSGYADGRTFMAALGKEQFDLVLLDWHLPEITGEDTLRWIRATLGYHLPVIFVTSRSSEEDLVQGLRSGADDYLIKPVRRHELLARIDALLRRAGVQTTRTEDAPFEIAGYRIDPIERTVQLQDQTIVLPAKEFDLALLFFQNVGRLMSRDHITMAVWNREVPATSRTLATHLSNIRQKLQLRPENGVRLISSYALGYRLELTHHDNNDESTVS